MSVLFAAVHNTTLLVIFDTEFIFATYWHDSEFGLFVHHHFVCTINQVAWTAAVSLLVILFLIIV